MECVQVRHPLLMMHLYITVRPERSTPHAATLYLVKESRCFVGRAAHTRGHAYSIEERLALVEDLPTPLLSRSHDSPRVSQLPARLAGERSMWAVKVSLQSLGGPPGTSTRLGGTSVFPSQIRRRAALDLGDMEQRCFMRSELLLALVAQATMRSASFFHLGRSGSLLPGP
ncbi:hypothetical protein GWK47_052502 [Chionoecetes opilio]|uniref:Uncharacterized protein n=1 Tax=Chionoecetes opilio TaxID=41210 RepID=A0A8J4Y6C7_CHIOP|nr:hypothetical protein GWK47_052502 [Chionoecetes opilio]